MALIHATPSIVPDFVVETIPTGGTRLEPEGKFTLTNNTTNTTHLSVKAFAVGLERTFLSAHTTIPGWTAQATDDDPIAGLPGSGGGLDAAKEYVFYTACDRNGVCGQLLGQGTEDRFTFSTFQVPIPFPPTELGIIAVDSTTGQEVTCIGRTGQEGCSLSSIPEPSTWLLLATGLVGLLGYGWRRRHDGSALSRGQAHWLS